MNAARWETSNDPWDMLGWRIGDCSVRKEGLWAVACCRRVWDLLTPDCREMVDAAEASLERTDHRVGVVDTTRWKETWGSVSIWDSEIEPARLAAWMLTFASIYKRAVGNVADAIAQCETGITGPSQQGWPREYSVVWRREQAVHAALLREVRGNPYRPVSFSSAWRTRDVMLLAHRIYEARDYGAMPILADALQDAGCDSADILDHCRDATAAHVRGCWVVDLVLGKQ